MITQEAHPARVPALIRLARALRAMHREQVYAMECLLRLSEAAGSRPADLDPNPQRLPPGGPVPALPRPGTPAAAAAPDFSDP